jgi:multidrug efflux pump subunit AcrB
MWIVKIALERPYTFVVLALLILLVSPVVILQTPTDIFPNIDIPVVAVSWQYSGMNAEELEGRLTTVYEKVLTTLVDNIQHIESTTVSGTAVVKIFLQPTASVDRANAQVTAASQSILRQLPPGTLPPLIVNYTASSVFQLPTTPVRFSDRMQDKAGKMPPRCQNNSGLNCFKLLRRPKPVPPAIGVQDLLLEI